MYLKKSRVTKLVMDNVLNRILMVMKYETYTLSISLRFKIEILLKLIEISLNVRKQLNFFRPNTF